MAYRVLGDRIPTSDQGRRFFTCLAERGLLRSYLLSVGDRRCAFVVGYVYRGVFHYAELGFDSELAAFSLALSCSFF